MHLDKNARNFVAGIDAAMALLNEEIFEKSNTANSKVLSFLKIVNLTTFNLRYDIVVTSDTICISSNTDGIKNLWHLVCTIQ